MVIQVQTIQDQVLGVEGVKGTTPDKWITDSRNFNLPKWSAISDDRKYKQYTCEQSLGKDVSISRSCCGLLCFKINLDHITGAITKRTQRKFVFLLTYIYEKFRTVCLSVYELDPTYYYTTPGFSWGAMLKCTKIKLELLCDNEMLYFIKMRIRGGISQCSKRYVKANNKYMNEFDSTKPSIYLLYFKST